MARTLPSPALHIIRGQAAAAKVDHIASLKRDIDDSATEAHNKTIGDHFTTLHEELITRYPILEVDCRQRSVSPTLLLQCYETMHTRTSRVVWVFTPLLGAALLGVCDLGTEKMIERARADEVYGFGLKIN